MNLSGGNTVILCALLSIFSILGYFGNKKLGKQWEYSVNQMSVVMEDDLVKSTFLQMLFYGQSCTVALHGFTYINDPFHPHNSPVGSLIPTPLTTEKQRPRETTVICSRPPAVSGIARTEMRFLDSRSTICGSLPRREAAVFIFPILLCLPAGDHPLLLRSLWGLKGESRHLGEDGSHP